MEVWKDIEGYEGKYQVSNTGIVKSLSRTRECKVNGGTIAKMTVPEKELKQWKRGNYLLVDLWNESKRDIRSVHVLVYETFVKKVDEGNFVHHKDENKENNSLENLVEMSALEHNQHHHCGKESWNKGVKANPESIKKQWETRNAKYGYAERNKNIYNDKLAGLSTKELSLKYKICTRSILDIVKKMKEQEQNGQ